MMETVSKDNFRNLVRAFVLGSIISTVSMTGMCYKLYCLTNKLVSLEATVASNKETGSEVDQLALDFDSMISDEVEEIRKDLVDIKASLSTSEIEVKQDEPVLDETQFAKTVFFPQQ